MVKIVLRDDDLCYFSKIEEIERVYAPLGDFPVTFAVVPRVVDLASKGGRPETRGNTIPRYIGDNKELTFWLKNKLSEGKCDIVMHGITHQYKFINGKKKAEMEWRDSDPNLVQMIKEEKEKLSILLEYPIVGFAAPSNKITKNCLKALTLNGLHFSGIVELKFNREFTVRNFMNYIKRWIFRVRYKLPYPDVMTYSDHKELNACIPASYEYLVKMYKKCKELDSPLVINIHYWDLRDCDRTRNIIYDFVKYALNDGAVPAKFSDCL